MSDMSKNWFEIDRKGLAKLIERRGKIALVQELVSNALDAEGTTRVEVLLEPEQGVPHATIVVNDNSPSGFADISHAWTLFAESNRKAYPTKRGRFNLGEKLVLALCTEASIISTKDAVMFDPRGRSKMKARRAAGTEFMGIARITRAELAEIKTDMRKLIPPVGVDIVVNGEKLPERVPLKIVEATLMTEVVDEENYLKRLPRKTAIHFHEPLPGETATLYELGMPVVELPGAKWHVDVQQKVPLNMDRDNVTPAYLRDVHTLTVNALHDQLTETEGNATFVNEALADKDVTPEAANKALDLKFTEKRAIWDPNDHEANMNLESQGYTLIKGGQLTGEQWANAKKHDTNLKPAGQIAPTKKVRFSPDGEDRWVPRDKWTPAMHMVVEYTLDVCRELLDKPVTVSILSDITESAAACFGDLGFVFNLGRLGHAWFNAAMNEGRPTVELNKLVIHELGHHYCPNHFDERYHESLCSLGAKLTQLALTKPKLFQRAVKD